MSNSRSGRGAFNESAFTSPASSGRRFNCP
jgi:hypothetical protein